MFEASKHETQSLQGLRAKARGYQTYMEKVEKKMKSVNRKKTSPLKYPRSRRNHPIMHLSSTMPGVAHPVAFIPMHREESMVAQIDTMVEMLETKELLMNRVTARFTAWVFPWLASERFVGSRDEFDRSYMGEASLDGGGVNAFVENTVLPAGGAAAIPIYLAAGLHGEEDDVVNTAYREAYNQIYNHRARQASKELTPRLISDNTLAPAFWNHRQFPHMVADFDQAMIDGQVALNVVAAKMPVRGLATSNSNAGSAGITGYDSTGFETYAAGVQVAQPGHPVLYVQQQSMGGGVYLPDVWAELQQDGITVSLAGLEQARKLQAFAKLRTQFEGLDDDHIIDMLMMGLSVPDQHLKQPFQIADQTVVFSQGKRYATDSGNLDDSATSGFAKGSLRLRVPQINTGAVVVVLMEILPEQIWERQQDWFFHARAKDGRPAHDFWPEADRDTLDQQKVDVVYNRDIDVSHSDPTGYFAFEPMNAKYNRAPPTIGGKFHRPAADTPTDTHRQRLWTVEGTDPVLTDSFFIVEPGTMHIKPFLDQVNDPFEVVARGNAVLTGNTQFGGLLIEQTGNYDAMLAKSPTDQIEESETPV